MGLLDDLQPGQKVLSCKVRKTIESLEPSDAEILAKAIIDPAWKTLALANALNAKGVPVGENAIRRHRSKACSCWKI